MAIARGEYGPSPDEPKVWFQSPEALAQVLSAKNRALLALIVETTLPRSCPVSSRPQPAQCRSIWTQRRRMPRERYHVNGGHEPVERQRRKQIM
jgi:hypothetical protein